MPLFFFSISLAILSSTLYHFSAKSTPANVNFGRIRLSVGRPGEFCIKQRMPEHLPEKQKTYILNISDKSECLLGKLLVDCE